MDELAAYLEAKKHVEAGRGVMAFFDKGKERQPAMSAKRLERNVVLEKSLTCLRQHPEKYYLALITGERWGLSVVDIDCKIKEDGTTKNGVLVWDEMVAKHGGVDNAVCARSRSGGYHFVFQFTPELKQGQAGAKTGVFKANDGQWADIDIRNSETNGFIICYPTQGYSWIRSPFDTPLTPCPQWIIDWHKNSTTKPKPKPKPEPKPKKSSSKKGNPCPLEELVRVLDNVEPQHWEPYDSWYQIMMAIYRLSHENEYPNDGLLLAHTHSRTKAPHKYNQEYLNDKWQGFQGVDIRVGLPFLVSLGNNTYEKVKQEFEQTAFKVRHPLEYCVENGKGGLYRYNRADFYNLYENKYFVNENGQEERFVPKWTSDPDIRTFNELAFEPPPYQADPNNYNLFKGLRGERLTCEPAPISACQPIFDHMSVMVNHEPKCYDYQEKWCAFQIQFPGKRPKTAPVYQGPPGIGKGIFWEWLGSKIIGDEYFFSTGTMRDLTGHFNEGVKNKVLIFLDETKGKDTFQQSAELKRVIDAPVTQVNEKYKNVVKLRNCAGWVFATNEKVFNVEAGCRRFVVFETSAEHKKDYDHWTALGKIMEDDTIVKAFYNHLMAVDLTGFNPEDLPVTEAREHMIEASAPIEVTFIEYLLSQEEDSLFPTVGSKPIKASIFQNRFTDFLQIKKCNENLLSGNRFGIAMKQWFDWKPTKHGIVYTLCRETVCDKLVDAGYKWFAGMRQ